MYSVMWYCVPGLLFADVSKEHWETNRGTQHHIPELNPQLMYNDIFLCQHYVNCKSESTVSMEGG
jgi:hypothetical protein